MASALRTTDHAAIQEWATARGGQPAHVKRTGGGDDPGILRIDFPGFSGGGSLEPLDWDRWFDAFEANGLALIYQDTTASGEQSRFNKLVRRRPEDETQDAPKHRSGERRKGRTTAIDLNTASEEELDALWGVGPVTAKKIVEFRQREGRIGSPDDLARIDGIDGATLDNLRRQLRA
jgi:competence ComEA-like helix-hairpin-helix protein